MGVAVMRPLRFWMVAIDFLWVLFSLASCAPVARPSGVSRDPDGTVVFHYVDAPSDATLEQVVDQARAAWRDVGVSPPWVSVIVGTPPDGADGWCFCDGTPVVVVRYRRADIVAHELGHAMGLRHVRGADELMSPVIGDDARIGPATLAEARRVGVLP